MSKFDADFQEFFADKTISELVSRSGTNSTLLSSLQGQQDRWDDNDKLNLFKRVILENSYLFKDKTVLDLRCGLGFFSIFAARAGARRVFAVDTSSSLALTAKIVERNGLQNVIQVLSGKLGGLAIPEKSVDVIICDWVGSFIINDDILPELIDAKNRLLAPNGVVS